MRLSLEHKPQFRQLDAKSWAACRRPGTVAGQYNARGAGLFRRNASKAGFINVFRQAVAPTGSDSLKCAARKIARTKSKATTAPCSSSISSGKLTFIPTPDCAVSRTHGGQITGLRVSRNGTLSGFVATLCQKSHNLHTVNQIGVAISASCKAFAYAGLNFGNVFSLGQPTDCAPSLWTSTERGRGRSRSRHLLPGAGFLPLLARAVTASRSNPRGLFFGACQ